MRIKPFEAIRPPPPLALEVASLPYDVGELEDARVIARGNPRSFLHVERPEVDLPDNFDPASGVDHASAAKNLKLFQHEGWLVREKSPALYLYRITLGTHKQTGIVACCHIEDYEKDIIRKHEKTKKPVEDQRTRHVEVTGAHTGPIFLLFRYKPEIQAMIDRLQAGKPLMGPNQWPPGMPAFRSALSAYYAEVLACGQRLLRGFASALGFLQPARASA